MGNCYVWLSAGTPYRYRGLFPLYGFACKVNYFYSVLQRIDIVQQLTGIPFESVVAVSGVVCSRPPAQENMV